MIKWSAIAFFDTIQVILTHYRKMPCRIDRLQVQEANIFLCFLIIFHLPDINPIVQQWI